MLTSLANDPRRWLRALFDAAVQSVSAERCLPPWLPAPPGGRTVVAGAGKAAAAMARVLDDRWRGDLCGLVVTRYGHAVPCPRVEVVEAAHPVPDAAGLEAARRIIELADGLGRDDLLVCLISGGASALLTAPVEGLTLADKQAVNRALLRSGASIHQMNVVRKHLSAIKGGALAARAYPAPVATLVISDVPGDDPATVGSGPTVADPSTLADARSVLRRHAIDPPAAVQAALEDPARETLKPGDERLALATTRVVACAQSALQAAAGLAREQGMEVVVLGDSLEGEARDVASVLAAMVRQVVRYDQPWRRPCVLLSGGETTVTVRGAGRGGRNAEFLLALGLALDGVDGVYALAADTDGIDGTESNAGCLLDPTTLARARAMGMDAAACLDENDGYGFFSGLDDLVVTGPTLTNVNDFRAILVLPGSP